ncbi:MAG: FdrA family protein [Clostridia bacterium]|nr:FdrA family protein [Clostridia bacterium]
MKQVVVKKNRYADSVSLMNISEQVSAVPGVENAEVQMATRANRDVLTTLGYQLPKGVGTADLVIAVRAESREALDAALARAEELLDHKGQSDVRYNDLADISPCMDPYDLCQISLPGEYAAAEAKKALALGMDVFMFSDNVSLEEEKELKSLAEEKGLLVMGPDAGVALIGGVALAAGSIIRPGPIGIVGASGSGAQEVGCIIEKCGLGISEIIGTGGRDLYPEIGGVTMKAGIRRLEKDEETKVIVLVSKLASLAVMDEVLTLADSCKKPVVAVFLGSDERLFEKHRVNAAFSLEEAALKAVELAGGDVSSFGFSESELERIADEALQKLTPEKKYFRGLYCGGTFTEEGMLYFSAHNPDTRLFSNLKTKYAETLKDPEKSVGHTVLDLGSEEFTAKAPHPVFDPELRLKRLRREIEDPETGVILLDFITGPGVAKDPVTSFAETCAQHRDLVFIAAICGSLEDPQDVQGAEKALREAGVIVTASNHQSARLASVLMKKLDGRNAK